MVRVGILFFQLVIPKSLRKQVLSVAHDNVAGHLELLKLTIAFCEIFSGPVLSLTWRDIVVHVTCVKL